MDESVDVSPTKLPMILKRTEDWDQWLYYIEDYSKTGGVWKFIDPARNIDIADTKPHYPEYSQVNEAATTFAQLKADEKVHFNALLERYNQQQVDYRRSEREMVKMGRIISGSVDNSYWVLLRRASTPREKIQALQSYLAPSTRGRELQIRRDYQAVMRQKINDVDLWLKLWTRVHTDALDNNLPDVQGDRGLEDFLTAVESLAPDFVHTVQTAIIQGTNSFTLLQIVEQFREARRRFKAPVRTTSHSAFSGQQQSGQGRQERRAPPPSPCLCGKNHHWFDCWYLNDNPTTPPFPGFERRPAILHRINERFANEPGLKERVEARIKGQSKTYQADKAKASKDDKDGDNDTLGAYTTAVYSVAREYKLKKHWILDSGSDIHVTNYLDGFIKTASSSNDDRLIAGASTYQIESFGTIKVPVQTPQGQKSITLLNVAYIPTFMTNLVSLSKLVEKGLHWDTEKGTLRKGGKDLCYIKRLGGHWTLTANPLDVDAPNDAGGAFHASKAPKQASLTQWHQILGHANLESIKHLPGSTDGAVVTYIDGRDSCDPCRLAKATQVISRDPDQERPAQKAFDRVSWDLIPVEEGFNGDKHVSHFKCFYTGMNHVYTQTSKGSNLETITQYLQFIEVHYKTKVKFIKLDGERSLGNAFEELAKDKGFIIERSAPDTQAQNGHAERAGRTIITMARTMRIHANLPSNLWPELVKTAGYYINRIPTKSLGWKTPFELANGTKPSLAHLHPIGCKAFMHLKDIPRLKKMEPRAQIGYLVGYNSTNQWRIWEPRSKQVKSVRDVIFDDGSLYNPDDLPTIPLLVDVPEDEPVPLTNDQIITDLSVQPLQDTIEMNLPFQPAQPALSRQEGQGRKQNAINPARAGA